MNEEITGVEVSGEIYPIKDEKTSDKTQTLEIKTQELESSVVTLKEEIKKIKMNNIYSTNEEVCGIWVDSKPIYRKVITINNPTSPNHREDVSSLNIKQIISFRGIFKDAEGSHTFPVPEFGDDRARFYLSYEEDRKTIFYEGGRQYGHTGKLIIIIEYTKTTD